MNRKLTIITNLKEAQKKEMQIHFMKAVALTNYSKLCCQLNEVPRLELINMLANSDDIKKLIAANNIFLEELK